MGDTGSRKKAEQGSGAWEDQPLAIDGSETPPTVDQPDLAEEADLGDTVPDEYFASDGDLPLGGGGNSLPPEAPARRARSPVTGSAPFLHVEIPLAAIDALQAWLLDTNHDDLPGPPGQPPIPYKRRLRDSDDLGEAFTEFLLDVIGRDLDADADRPPHERHYNTEAWLGQSFRTALLRHQQADIETAVATAVRTLKERLMARAKQLLPTVDEDHWRYLFDLPE